MTWKLKCFETSGFQNSPQQIICSIFKFIRGTRAALLLRHCSQLKYQCLRERMGCNNRWRQAEHMERALNHLSVTTACWRVLSSLSSNQPHWARDEAGFFFFYCLMSRNLNFCMNMGRDVSNVCLRSAHSCVLLALSEWRPVHPTQQVSLQSGVEWTRLLQVISDNATNEEDSLKTPNKHLEFQTRAWMLFLLLFAGKGNRTITSKDSTQLHVNHPMKGILV